jgi:hypothetical protein
VLAGAGLAGWGVAGAGQAAAQIIVTGCPVSGSGPGFEAVFFCYTGGSQTWTVPAGVTSATVTLYGAEGGGQPDDSGDGGFGAEVTGTLPVSPGEVLQVNVGQDGGYSGSNGTGSAFGDGGDGGVDAGGGGGATDVRTPASDASYPLGNRVLVAGGGGGGGMTSIGSEQGDFTANGGNSDSNGSAGYSDVEGGGTCGETVGGGGAGDAGTPAGDSAGGQGGTVTCSSSSNLTAGDAGTNGTLGTGGNGGVSVTGGGGGGGGYYGGGGGGGGARDTGVTLDEGGGGGGGGGSSYTDPSATDTSVSDGVAAPDDSPNGEVSIIYSTVTSTAPAFTADSPPLTAATGTPYSYQFTASGTPAPTFTLGGGAPSWLSVNSSTGLVSGTPPAGTKSFTYSVTASNSAGSVTAGPFTVTVSNKADIKAGLSCPAGLTVGSSGTCTLTVTNAGPALATSVVAGATVPAQLKVTACSDSCSRLGGLLAWKLGSLPSGQSDTLTISVTATRTGVAIVAAADAAANPDPNLLNNVAAAKVNVTKS